MHETSWKKIDFAHRSSALARPGIRMLRAVKIPASYDAWRPPKRRKNDSDRIRFLQVLEINYSSFFLDFGGVRQFQTSKSASASNFFPDAHMIFGGPCDQNLQQKRFVLRKRCLCEPYLRVPKSISRAAHGRGDGCD